MCVHVNTMPDDCLLLIFDRMPLSDLLHLDRVCPRWATLLPSACSRRRLLVLILGPLDETNFEIPFSSNLNISFEGRYSYHDLPVLERESSFTLSCLLPQNESKQNTSFDQFLSYGDESQGFFDILYPTSLGGHAEAFTEMSRFRNAHLSGQLVAYLTHLFPNVDNLVVIHPRCTEDELNVVIDLLVQSCWSSLNTLKLWLRTLEVDDRHADRLEHHPVHTLLRTINQQTTLQQLTLDIDGDGQDEYTFPVECYSFIAKLKVVKLLLGIYVGDDLICDIVQRFDSTQLRYIGLGSYLEAVDDPMQVVLSPKLKFTTKVAQLYWHLYFESVEQLSELCYHYTSLTMLEIIWSAQITFTQVVSNLCSLTQLTHLKLFISFRDLPVDPFALVQRVEGDVQEEAQLRISLPQIKILELVSSKRSHRDFESLSPVVFASVEVLIWRNNHWIGCDICRRTINGQHDHQRTNKCYRLMILSLKNRMTNPLLRLYAKCVDSPLYIDWSNAENDDLLAIGDGDQVEQPPEDVEA